MSERSPVLQRRIANALQALNEMAANELGRSTDVSEVLLRSRRKRRKTRARVMPTSPKLRALNVYRRKHPNASLRDAALAVGFNVH